MRFDLITVLPALLESPFAHSILQRAQKKGLAEIERGDLLEHDEVGARLEKLLTDKQLRP